MTNSCPPNWPGWTARSAAPDTERRRLIDLYQGGFIELPEMQRRATEVSSRRKELQHKRTSLADERTALARDNKLRHRVHDFAARIHAVNGTLDYTQKQQLMRLLIEDVRVTGWHVEIRLRVALDPPPPDPTGPPNPEGKPSPHPRPASSQDGLGSVSVSGHGRAFLPAPETTRPPPPSRHRQRGPVRATPRPTPGELRDGRQLARSKRLNDPQFTLRAGIADTVGWYRRHVDLVRL